MAGMLFVDRSPSVKPHHGHHLLTFTSGDTKTELLLTRHAMLALLNLPHDLSEGAASEIVPFVPRSNRAGR